MRSVVAVAMFFFLFSQGAVSASLGGFDSYSSSTQSLLKSIVSQLGVADPGDDAKEKIYDQIDMALGGDWYSYWIGRTDLSKSKYDDNSEKGFIQVLLATKDSGTWVLTFSKEQSVDQIIVSTTQIRHGSQDGALSVYNEQTENADRYEVKKETGKYAFIQEKGKVAFSIINVGSGTGSVAYVNQFAIDL